MTLVFYSLLSSPSLFRLSFVTPFPPSSPPRLPLPFSTDFPLPISDCDPHFPPASLFPSPAWQDSSETGHFASRGGVCLSNLFLPNEELWPRLVAPTTFASIERPNPNALTTTTQHRQPSILATLCGYLRADCLHPFTRCPSYRGSMCPVSRIL